MKLKECEQSLNEPLREATIMLLLRDDEVLLAMKKRGFGAGKWNGVGGKPNPGEDIRSAAIRETEEEVMVTPLDIEEVCVLNFYFPLVPADKNWNQCVRVYVCRNWIGEPVETEEMMPRWFKLADVPYQEMWNDDELWMPKVFAGKSVKGSFVFGENEELVEHFLEEAYSHKFKYFDLRGYSLQVLAGTPCR
jgi:8-oxo-dGTP pyrophosphatase MutT (NUDIX family)